MRDVKSLPRYRAEKVLRDKFLSSNLAGCAPSEQAEDCKKEKLDPLIGRYLSLVKKKVRLSCKLEFSPADAQTV